MNISASNHRGSIYLKSTCEPLARQIVLADVTEAMCQGTSSRFRGNCTNSATPVGHELTARRELRQTGGQPLGLRFHCSFNFVILSAARGDPASRESERKSKDLCISSLERRRPILPDCCRSARGHSSAIDTLEHLHVFSVAMTYPPPAP